MVSAFIEVGIIGIRVFYSMLPLICFKYFRPNEKDIYSDDCMKWATTLYLTLQIVFGIFLEPFFLKNALIKIPIPYHPDTLLPSLAFKPPDIMHILSRIWLAGIIFLTLAVLILRRKISKAFLNRITVLNAIILWYNPLYWYLVKITPHAKEENEDAHAERLNKKVLIPLIILCVLFTMSSFLFIDCTYTLPASSDIVRVLGTKDNPQYDFDFLSRLDQGKSFGTPYVYIGSQYNSKRIIDYISWSYPEDIAPEQAWNNIQPVIDRLTELLGPAEKQPPKFLFLTLATNRLQWETLTETGETAVIEMRLLPNGSNYNDEVKDTPEIELFYTLKQT